MMQNLLDVPKQKKYSVDDILKEHGHTPSDLRPCYPDLNRIELVWADIKGEISRISLNYNLQEMKELAEKIFNEYSPETRMKCDSVEKLENEYKVNACIQILKQID